MTWTGSDCVYSGPDRFPKGEEIVKITYRNDSSVVVTVFVSPPLSPSDAVSFREVDPETELTNSLILRDAGDLAFFCVPGEALDASADAAVVGGFITVEESTATVEEEPTPPGTVSVEGLIGTWRYEDRGSFVLFNEDGTYHVSNLSADIEDSTIELGQFTLEGTLLTFISNEDSESCEAGQRGSYEMEALEKGPSGEDRIGQTLVEDECSVRPPPGGDDTLRRVS